MEISEEGRLLIERREGVVLSAYRDSVGILTIGVGHTSAAGEPKVTPGMRITRAEASMILRRDLADVEQAIRKLVRVDLNQNEFDALGSLIFNIGRTNFGYSTLLRRLNAGDRQGAADQFLVWNKSRVNGKLVTLKGLKTRRESEREQFLTPPPPVVPQTEQATTPVRAAGLVIPLINVIANLLFSQKGKA